MRGVVLNWFKSYLSCIVRSVLNLITVCLPLTAAYVAFPKDGSVISSPCTPLCTLISEPPPLCRQYTTFHFINLIQISNITQFQIALSG